MWLSRMAPTDLYADAQQKTQMNQLFEIPLRPAMVRATLHDTSLP